MTKYECKVIKQIKACFEMCFKFDDRRHILAKKDDPLYFYKRETFIYYKKYENWIWPGGQHIYSDMSDYENISLKLVGVGYFEREIFFVGARISENIFRSEDGGRLNIVFWVLYRCRETFIQNSLKLSIFSKTIASIYAGRICLSNSKSKTVD